MPVHPDEELGSIDYIVVEFPPGTDRFTGELMDELMRLVSAGTVRVLDLLILHKDADGNIEAVEVEDMDDLGELGALEGELAEILAAEDVAHLAEAMEPDTVAGVLVWENTWSAPFAVAARRMGGQLIAEGRIRTQALIASMTAATEGD